MGSSDNTCLFQLIHQATCTVIANSEFPLNQTGASALFANDETGGILEHRIKMLHINVTTLATFAIISIRFGQFEGRQITLLIGYELVDALHLRCIDKCTLYANGFSAIQIEHITTTYQLLGTGTIQYSTRVDHGTHAESNTAGEVGLDGTRNDVCCWTLSGNDHVDAHGTC